MEISQEIKGLCRKKNQRSTGEEGNTVVISLGRGVISEDV
jgi:hypothetical protein